MSEQSTLPVLYAVRGWSDGPFEYVDEMLSTGTEVVDVYIPPAAFPDLGAWGRAIIELIRAQHDFTTPLHLVGYCAGGNLLLATVHELEAIGIRPEYVALIDVRQELESVTMQRGIDSAYHVPWKVRLRRALIRLTPPDRESLGSVLRSAVRRAARLVVDLPRRGWRGRKWRDPQRVDAMNLLYSWEYRPVTVPVHLYNTHDSSRRYSKDDPSLHIGKNLWGGFLIRFVDGTHLSCVQSPHSTTLIEQITADRRAVVAGSDVFQ